MHIGRTLRMCWKQVVVSVVIAMVAQTARTLEVHETTGGDSYLVVHMCQLLFVIGEAY